MNFKAATDELMAMGIPLPAIASALGVAYTTVRAFRLDPESLSYRHPPDGWLPVIARLARERGRELSGFADELEHAATHE